jgi:hypothetical protein
MKTKKIPMLMITVVVCLFVIACVMAEPLPPEPGCVFYGNVYVDGKPAQDGLNITAEDSGCSQTWTTETKNGTYGWSFRGSSTFIIPSDNSNTSTPNGGTDGDIVTFYVQGIQASQTGTFESTGAEKVDLSIQGTPLPPSPDTSSNGLTNFQYVLYAAVIVTAAVIGSVGVFWRRRNGLKMRLIKERVAKARNRRKDPNK